MLKVFVVAATTPNWPILCELYRTMDAPIPFRNAQSTYGAYHAQFPQAEKYLTFGVVGLLDGICALAKHIPLQIVETFPNGFRLAFITVRNLEQWEDLSCPMVKDFLKQATLLKKRA